MLSQQQCSALEDSKVVTRIDGDLNECLPSVSVGCSTSATICVAQYRQHICCGAYLFLPEGNALAMRLDDATVIVTPICLCQLDLSILQIGVASQVHLAKITQNACSSLPPCQSRHSQGIHSTSNLLLPQHQMQVSVCCEAGVNAAGRG